MSCVLSRCSVSLNQAAASARHEELITKVCRQSMHTVYLKICLPYLRNMSLPSPQVHFMGSPILLFKPTFLFPSYLKSCCLVVLFQTFCDEANMRVAANLNTLRDPVQLQGFKSMVSNESNRSPMFSDLEISVSKNCRKDRPWVASFRFLVAP